MAFFLTKTKALSHLAEYACAFGLPPCLMLQRSLFTKHVLFTKDLQIHKINDEVKASDIHKNLGKIVDLDADFDEVKFIPENLKKEKRIKIKKGREAATELVEGENYNNQINRDNNFNNDENSKSITNVLKQNTNLMRSVIIGLKSKKRRKKCNEIILEGKRLITDALNSGCTPVKIFYSRVSDLKLMGIPENVPSFKVPYESFKVWGDTVTSQGVLAVFEVPELENIEPDYCALPLTIICDNIRDPGNLGAVLRIVASAGCKKLILTKGCIDIWEPKVLRAAAGAHFRLPIKTDYLWSNIETEVDENNKVILADLKYTQNNNSAPKPFQKYLAASEDLPIHCYSSVQYNDENAVLILGGETYGLSDEAYAFASKRKSVRVFIPMSNGVESLNNAVSLGILVYDFKRQLDILRSKQDITTNESQTEIEANSQNRIEN